MNLNHCTNPIVLLLELYCGFFKVLKHCSQSPHTIEVLLNAYSHLKVTDTWVESVPEDAFKASCSGY